MPKMKISGEKFNLIKQKYLARAAHEDELIKTLGPAGIARRDEFLLPVGLEVAEYLQALIIAAKSQYAVEVGTSYGYSTLFIAHALSKTGGRLHTFEIDAEKQKYAKNEIDAAGLGDFVEFHLGDAVQKLPKLQNGIDFVLLDVWKELYIPSFDIVFPKMKRRGILLADNMLLPPVHIEDAQIYRKHVRAQKGLEACLLDIGAGIDVMVKN